MGCSTSEAATSSPAGDSTAQEKSWPSWIIGERAVRIMMLRISRTTDVRRVWISSSTIASTTPLMSSGGLVMLLYSRL